MTKLLGRVLNRDNVLLITVLVFALVVRVIFLGHFPIGMTHDELNNIFVAKSLFLTHSFPPGTAPAVLPTNMSNFTITVPEVPALFLSVLVGPLSSSLFVGRIMGAVLSILGLLALYFIVFHLTKKRSFALISILIMAINPWSILMGRTMCEVNFFVTFFLWGFLVLIKQKGWKVFYALPLYLLGFFSYTGGQISFFIFIVVTLIYRYWTVENGKKDLKIYLIFGSIVSLIFAVYVFVATTNQSFKVRSGELYLPSSPAIFEKVATERELTIPTPLNVLFINKATVYFKGFVDKYLNTFSVNHLFLNGETRAVFSYQTHGTFYLIDFLFIVIGISSLFALNKKSWSLVLALLVGCSITSGLSVVESSYSQRVGLIFPFLIILSGVGVGTLISAVKLKRARVVLSVVIAGAYVVSFANLMHTYFYRFPVYASDGWFFQDRVLSSYLKKSEEVYPDTKLLVYTNEPKIVFEEYLFYNNLYNKNNAIAINKQLDKKDYSIGNIKFTDKCLTQPPDKDSVLIIDGSFVCKELSALPTTVRITRLKDIYENYRIYNDKLCSNVTLGRFVLRTAYNNFEIEKQLPKEFCTNWITEIKE